MSTGTDAERWRIKTRLLEILATADLESVTERKITNQLVGPCTAPLSDLSPVAHGHVLSCTQVDELGVDRGVYAAFIKVCVQLRGYSIQAHVGMCRMRSCPS